MNIRQEILREHTKTNANKIAKYISENPLAIGELFACFTDDDNRLAQRAAWPMGMLGDTKPEIVLPYVQQLLELAIDKTKHDAVRRNSLRVLQFVEIPEEYHGSAVNNCFQALNDRKEPVAIRVFAMTVLASICEVFPELMHELKESIEAQMQFNEPAFLSRGRMVLKKLAKLEKK